MSAFSGQPTAVPLPMPLPRIEQVVVGFLRNEIGRAGFEKGVVGVSGGLDSAVVLLLAVRALGAQNVLAMRLPYRESSPSSLEDGAAVIASAGCASETIDITPLVDTFAAATDCSDTARLGNAMARARMSVLYDRALRDRALVIGTSNKTELLLGYSTRWGDSAFDLDPIGDLYKAQVRALAQQLGVPPPILAKPPSADLWPGQTDEQELALTYDEADRVLWYLVDARGSAEAAARATGVDPAVVQRIRQRVQRFQFKRSLPLICKLHPRTVGIDFRFPRDWGT